MIRVLVADDQHLIRTGVTALLDAAGGMVVVGEARDAREAVNLAERLHPDVVIIEPRIAGMNGIKAIRRILDRQPTARVLVLTDSADDADIYGSLGAGATGYLLKENAPEHLVEAVRVVTRGQPALAASVMGRVVQRAVDAHNQERQSRSVGTYAGLGLLSQREQDVLALVGAGLSNSEIAGEIHLGVTSVKTHLSAAMRKLGLRNRTQAAVVAHRLGLAVDRRTPSQTLTQGESTRDRSGSPA